MCISLLIVIIFVTSCGGGNKITEDSKEIQIKKSFTKTLDMYQSKILRIYTTKKDTEMANLKKVTKGCGRYTQISLKVINRVN